jgi:hypothetical protein
MKNENNPEVRLQFENDLLKLKLMAEFGMDNSGDDTDHLDPFLENQWLNEIYEFERIHSGVKTISLGEFLGNPVIKPVDEYDNNSLKIELNKLLALLNENNISLTCICDYDDRTIFKFITEELFKTEMENVRLNGCTTQFIYEDFHPNHNYDLRQQAGEFIHALFKRKWERFDEIMLCDQITTSSNKKITRDKFIEQINQFQYVWKEFIHVEFEITDSGFNLEDDSGYVNLKLNYIAFAETNKSIFMTGTAGIGFKLVYGYWNISQVCIPGFNH